MSTFQQACEAIPTLTDEQLDIVFELLKTRRKALHEARSAANAVALQVGEVCRIDQLSPKYLNGQSVVVEHNPSVLHTKKAGLIDVYLEHPIRHYDAGSTLTVPASCLTPTGEKREPPAKAEVLEFNEWRTG